MNHISVLFNRLIISIYRHCRKAASTNADLFRYKGEKADYFNLKGKATWRCIMIIDRLIDGFIKQYGISKIYNKSLYDLDSCFSINAAFTLIKHGAAQETDFPTDKPISAIMEFDSFLTRDKTYEKYRNDIELNNIARLASDTEKEYISLIRVLAVYKTVVEKNAKYTLEIEECKRLCGVTEYLGQNLYDITEPHILNEAFEAAELMECLTYLGIATFNGVSIKDLSLFNLEKCDNQYYSDNHTPIGFNKEARQQYLDEVKKDEQQEAEKKRLKEEQAKSEARSTAAKARRAAKKAETLAAEQKAKAVKKKSAVKPVKAIKAKPDTKKAVIKSINRKTKKAS